ncbi:beta-galactosidase [Aliishimia ponticola]|nr:beta-galactosidase [Aliishimia ponticola]
MPSIGVCYYPEHWAEETWPRDARRMVDTGITHVRIGEFAWSRIEPRPGVFDWDWLDRAIDVLASAGLKIVLGTPSATPPRWMLDRFPDMLAVDAAGAPRKFGSRRHYCHAHDGYRDAAADMCRVLGERYGRDARIAAWQIDNEYGCHDTVLSYSDAARHAFRDWLARKYQSPEALNRAWGNVFWSMEYADWTDVDLPNLTVTQPNPAHELDYRRFVSDMVAQWNARQVAALRPLTDAPLLHNYMGRVLEFDHFDVGADLDIASWDSYPIGFLSDRLEAAPAHKARFMRQGDPDFQAFHHDLYRAVGKGRWWVMEQQPGPVNWAPSNPAPAPGMVRLWAIEAVAHGAEVVSYFRWRQAPFAQEQLHAGLMYPDDTPAPGLTEAKRAADDLAALPAQLTPSARVALIFDYQSDWAWKTLPQGAGFDYFDLAFSAYRALRRAGMSIDILPLETARDYGGYDLIVAPGLMTLNAAEMQALTASGATLLMGPRSNLQTPDFQIPNPPGPAIPGLDLQIMQVESYPQGYAPHVRDDRHIGIWQEHGRGTAEVALRRRDGIPILYRAGKIHYLAAWPDDALWGDIVQDLTGAPSLLPPGLRIRDTESHRFVINYDLDPVDWDGHTVPGCDALILPRS